MQKHCWAHGDFEVLIWRGGPAMADWRRPKIFSPLPWVSREKDRGCPFDCGLCPDHRQRSCSIIVEVAARCDLNCPVCYADAGREAQDPLISTIAGWFARLRANGVTGNIQLSGGEPTQRDDLPRIAALGREAGFAFIQVNTNGLRLAREAGYAEVLRRAGVSSIFLQFDGVDDQVYDALRGRALWAEKQAAIRACATAGLGVVLVPTLVPGVNVGSVGAILQAALAWYPAVRGVHFQPISYFGRHPQPPALTARLTLPELMRAIETQTGGGFKARHFKAPGCE
ncbi:MAG: radical SAM protein, partial [Desulfatitalea sp.]|nr:radical SAM protein [Desulfatitalea sp.]NNJ99010.1 radical SAM protein [Desulfatitalea sp.]